jgi:hypothetical protein
MSTYNSKDSLVLDRQLKVQRLVIPFKIVGSATSANVVISCDEPSIMFLATEGVDQITDALADGETASYTQSPDDSDGKFNIFVKVGEEVEKICQSRVSNRTTGVQSPSFLGDADGLSSDKNMMISVDSADNIASSSTFEYCLELEYIVQD